MSIDDFVRYQKSRDSAENLGILKIVKILVIFKECFSIRSLIIKIGICRIFSGIVGNGRSHWVYLAVLKLVSLGTSRSKNVGVLAPKLPFLGDFLA